jgi:hypothetical protein
MGTSHSRVNLQAIAALADLADYSPAFAVRAAAAIGVADHLSEGPRDIDYLAQQSGCDAHALLRLLRCLVAKSVFSEPSPGSFALEPVGDLLRTDHPYSMRWFFRLEPDVEALAGLEHSVRTGQASFDKIFGKPYFDWMAAHDVPRERFRESQRSLNRLEFLAISRSYPWQEARSIVDIGGNDGSLLAGLLQRHPSLTGTVFDLPATAAKSAVIFEQAGVKDRARSVAGNVFQGGVPQGADVYTIKRVLVGFSDDEAVVALSSIRDAMAPNSRLVIMEPTRSAADKVGVSLDLLMLVLGLGRVRQPEEFQALMTRSGIKPTRIQNAGLITLIEGVRDAS